MRNIEISLFHNFSIIVDGEDITHIFQVSKKKLLLFQYLILHRGEKVLAQELMDVICDRAVSINPENTLKTQISRLRKELSDYQIDFLIRTGRGGYLFDPGESCTIDLYEFQDLCERAVSIKTLGSEHIRCFESVLSLYKGSLEYGALQNDVMIAKSHQFEKLYLDTIYKYVNLLKWEKKYEDIMRVAKIGLEISPLDSFFHVELLSSLVNLGHSNEATNLYQSILQLYNSNLGIVPSSELLNFHTNLLSHDLFNAKKIETVLEDLKDYPLVDGVLICEYTVFKYIYNLLIRSFHRTKIPMFLAIINIRYLDNAQPVPIEIDTTMQKLQVIIQNSLRNSDILSRFDLSNFAILMPSIANYKVGHAVLERIKYKFYEDPSNAKFTFTYKLLQANEHDET